MADKLHIQCNLRDSFCGIGLYIGSHWQLVKFESQHGRGKSKWLADFSLGVSICNIAGY